MKKESTFDLNKSANSSFLSILKYHYVFVFILIFAAAFYMIINTSQIINTPTDEAFYESEKTNVSSQFDEATIKKVKDLQYSDAPSNAPVFDNTIRSNPFVEQSPKSR